MGDARPIATLRARLEDFQVDEVPAYAPCGSGEHLYVTFRKRGLDTLEAVRRLARALGVSPRDAGTAGLKDRHAVTVQTASFALPLARPVPEAGALEVEGVEVLSLARHNNKLRTGHLVGNRFTLVLRGVDPARIAEVREGFERLGREGLPNRYGVQRFGRQGDNAAEALAWLMGRGRAPREERVRRLQFSALQSELFNRVLDRREAQGTWARVLVGDLAVRQAGGRPFAVSDDASAAALASDVAAGEVSATGPMFGARMPWPTGEVGELEREVLRASLAEAGADEGLFDRHRGLGEGARRALRLTPAQMRVEQLDDEGEAGTLRVAFVLPRGAYATTVVEAICQAHDATRTATGSGSTPPGIVSAGDHEPEGNQEIS